MMTSLQRAAGTTGWLLTVQKQYLSDTQAEQKVSPVKRGSGRVYARCPRKRREAPPLSVYVGGGSIHVLRAAYIGAKSKFLNKSYNSQ